MLRPRRLSICYVAPGASYRRGSGHSRQVLTLARALARDAEVAVVFRRLIDEVEVPGVAVAALESDRAPASDLVPSRRALGVFVQRRASSFGMVLEGSWPMSGKLAARCAQRGVPAISVLDRFPTASWLGSLDVGNTWLGFRASGRYLRQASDDRGRQRGDPRRHRRTVARESGPHHGHRARDRSYDLRAEGPDRSAPTAWTGSNPPHRAGRRRTRARHRSGASHRSRSARRRSVASAPCAGPRRAPKDARASCRPGRVSSLSTPPRRTRRWRRYIAAADLCVSFEAGDPAFTVSECLSSARPVAVPAVEDRPPVAVRHLVTGFLVQHDLLAWIRFLQRDCPSRNTLRMMGQAASATPIDHVDRIAAAYLAVMDRAPAQATRASG